MFYIELNIASCTVSFVHTLEEIGKKYGVQIIHHGWDRLVFGIDLDTEIAKFEDELKDAAKHEAGISLYDLMV